MTRVVVLPLVVAESNSKHPLVCAGHYTNHHKTDRLLPSPAQSTCPAHAIAKPALLDALLCPRPL